MELLSFLTILLGAAIIDLFLGDPPDRWHPVAWIGRVIHVTEKRAPGGKTAQLLYGAGLLAVGVFLISGFFVLVEQWLPADRPLGLLVHIILLSLSFSFRGLRMAGKRVGNALRAGELDQARRWLGWDLVSRPTDQLSEGQVAAAVIESIAENLTDSLMAPLLAYALFGLPGAWVYRFVNTADAMIGYRSPEYEYLGKPAARLDDLLNWIPARLASLAMVVGAPFAGASWSGALRAIRADRQATASPNAGWTMAAAGGALGLQLEKTGHYTLNRSGREAVAGDITRADRLLAVSGVGSVALTVLVGGLLRAF
ncbi:MAG: adenosylcobinamide-phosphate synthase CbiB [Anaerolineales bacterium]